MAAREEVWEVVAVGEERRERRRDVDVERRVVTVDRVWAGRGADMVFEGVLRGVVAPPT